jgi:hypothetical protein
VSTAGFGETNINDARRAALCRIDPHGLIGLSPKQLIERCGLWAATSTTVSSGRTMEQITYGDPARDIPVFYVFVLNGAVHSVTVP